jgi:Rieske Fe-S protein
MVGCTVPVRSFRAPLAPTVLVPLETYPELSRDGGMLKVHLGNSGRAIFVRRLSEHSFDSLSAVCTHQGCIVDPSGIGFRCPCHGSSYDRDGNNIVGPAPSPLERFRVTATRRFVRVHLGEQ